MTNRPPARAYRIRGGALGTRGTLGALCNPAVVFLGIALGALGACAPRPLKLPEGPGAPFDGFAAAYAEASRACAGVRTLTAELALSGRAGRTKLRGRVLAGFERPDRARLEGVAPFGAPVFIFVARGGRATLLLPRDGRVLRDAPPASIVEALTGVPLGPADLAAALSGCGLPPAQPVGGRRFSDGWGSVDLERGATVYLRQQGAGWIIAAASGRGYTVEYSERAGDRPARVRVRTSETAAVPADLSVALSQVDINVDLDAAAFEVDVPADAQPITLAELREAGPLGIRNRTQDE
jgi:hypothetical protein